MEMYTHISVKTKTKCHLKEAHVFRTFSLRRVVKRFRIRSKEAARERMSKLYQEELQRLMQSQQRGKMLGNAAAGVGLGKSNF